jgi:hypothetical protein
LITTRLDSKVKIRYNSSKLLEEETMPGNTKNLNTYVYYDHNHAKLFDTLKQVLIGTPPAYEASEGLSRPDSFIYKTESTTLRLYPQPGSISERYEHLNCPPPSLILILYDTKELNSYNKLHSKFGTKVKGHADSNTPIQFVQLNLDRTCDNTALRLMHAAFYEDTKQSTNILDLKTNADPQLDAEIRLNGVTLVSTTHSAHQASTLFATATNGTVDEPAQKGPSCTIA